MQPDFYHLIIYSPLSHAEKIRTALADAGGGKIGNYDACSFSVRGIGRFRPNEKADPTIGKIGEMTEVEEERIEVVVIATELPSVLDAVRKVHPYEEPAIHVIPMLDYKKFL